MLLLLWVKFHGRHRYKMYCTVNRLCKCFLLLKMDLLIVPSLLSANEVMKMKTDKDNY